MKDSRKNKNPEEKSRPINQYSDEELEDLDLSGMNISQLSEVADRFNYPVEMLDVAKLRRDLTAEQHRRKQERRDIHAIEIAKGASTDSRSALKRADIAILIALFGIVVSVALWYFGKH